MRRSFCPDGSISLMKIILLVSRLSLQTPQSLQLSFSSSTHQHLKRECDPKTKLRALQTQHYMDALALYFTSMAINARWALLLHPQGFVDKAQNAPVGVKCVDGSIFSIPCVTWKPLSTTSELVKEVLWTFHSLNQCLWMLCIRARNIKYLPQIQKNSTKSMWPISVFLIGLNGYALIKHSRKPWIFFK